MRNVLSSLMALLLVSGFAAGLQTSVSAQSESTVVTQITDSSGAPGAEISVDSIADPFEDYDDFSSPQRGFRFVLVTLTITNVGELPYLFQPYSVTLVDSDGFVVTTGYATYEEGVAAPAFTGEPIEPGQSVTGAIPFEVLADVEIASIVYQPGYDRIFLLASNGSAPETGSPVALLGEEGSEIGTISIDEFVDPLTEFDPSYPAPRGYHYAAATVTIENTGDRPLSVDPGMFPLVDSDGYIANSYGVYRGDAPEVPDLEYADLAPGDSVTGIISYTVFEGATPVWIGYSSGGTQLVIVAALADTGATPSIADIPAAAAGTPVADDADEPDETDDSVADDSTPAAAVEGECGDVAAWLERTSERLNVMEDAPFDFDTVEDVDAVDDETIAEFLESLEDLYDEQASDTPPAIAEDFQTALLDLINTQIDGLNELIDARDNGDDIQPILDEFEERFDQVGEDYFSSYATLAEACPSIDE